MTKFYLVGTAGYVCNVFESEWAACKAMPLRDLFHMFPHSGLTADNTFVKSMRRVWDSGFEDCEIRCQWLDPASGQHMTVYKRAC